MDECVIDRTCQLIFLCTIQSAMYCEGNGNVMSDSEMRVKQSAYKKKKQL